MSGPILGRRILAVLFEQLASMPSLIAVPNATIASAAAQATQQTTPGPKAVSWKAENAAFSIKIGDSYDSAIAVHCRLGAPRWRVSDALMPRRNDRGAHSLHSEIAALCQYASVTLTTVEPAPGIFRHADGRCLRAVGATSRHKRK